MTNTSQQKRREGESGEGRDEMLEPSPFQKGHVLMPARHAELVAARGCGRPDRLLGPPPQKLSCKRTLQTRDKAEPELPLLRGDKPSATLFNTSLREYRCDDYDILRCCS